MKEVFHKNNSFGQVMVGSMLSNANLSDWEPAGGSPNNCLKPPAASLGDSTLLYLLIDFLSNFHADHFKWDLLKSELLPPIKIKSENLIHNVWYFRCGWKNACDCLFFALAHCFIPYLFWMQGRKGNEINICDDLVLQEDYWSILTMTPMIIVMKNCLKALSLSETKLLYFYIHISG